MGGSSVIVHLIRHEKTKANLERKYIGWTDESIVYDKVNCIVPIHTDVVYGSDLKRCLETARLYFPNAVFHPFFELRELNFGDFEMKTYEDLKDDERYRQWIDVPQKVTPPNGEAFTAFQKRVLDCFQQIVEHPGIYVFVVHGGVIRLILSKFCEEKNFQEVVVQHRNIYTLFWDDIESLKGGEVCNRLSVAPIMVNENL
ncbi:histidine phosphatase family protein [Ureibacillus thermophilus]|uniref:Histidine phosphatase family protein n=1 Tax=Ureibacillus thermophilus TaxID=367743 RepID=A0A4P6UWD0_9BACL|nr:histidine phosphatase family protein [Ureibacillus thermophilus]QBK25922.1 histidine phosphatase family protein [Ureibacillus thermophilus]